jgi:uncharacterized protein YecT (DUF1311 family)
VTLLREYTSELLARRSLLLLKASLRSSSPFFICFVFATVSACSAPWRNSAESPSKLVPSEWKPSLEEVQTFVQGELEAKSQKSQQYLNRTSQNLSDLTDAQLFITYILLMQHLDGKEQNSLFDEQKYWLAKRDELARSAVVSKGGSLAPLEYASAFRQVSEKRLAELKQRLVQMTNRKNNTNRKEK